jgi:SAM-dependent methyltransferase
MDKTTIDTLLKTSLKNILEKTENLLLHDKISTFWQQHLKKYINEVARLHGNIERNEIAKPDAENRFFALTNEIMQKAENLEKNLSQKVTIKRVKQNFRELVGGWIYKGLIVKRAYEKPRGYPGDYLTLENIYNEQSSSPGIGYYSDRYFLENEYSVAVRNRKDKMKEILMDFIKYNNNSTIKFLNFACGSCREIKELFIDERLHTNKKIVFTLVDHDEEALEFAKNLFKNAPPNLELNYLKVDVLKLAENTELRAHLVNQDFVYSIGLADYLPDRILKNFIKFCIGTLAKNGKFIITHKDIERCHPISPDWFCNWDFYSRNEKHLVDLVKSVGVTDFNIETIIREKSKRILFLLIINKN